MSFSFHDFSMEKQARVYLQVRISYTMYAYTELIEAKAGQTHRQYLFGY